MNISSVNLSNLGNNVLQSGDMVSTAQGVEEILSVASQKVTANLTEQILTAGTQQSTIEKALIAAGLPASDRNVTMVSLLMKAGEPIHKEALVQMNKQMLQYPQEEIRTFVEMKQLGISVTKNHLEQYHSYKNYEHQIQTAANEIIAMVPDSFNEIAKESPRSALQFYHNLIEVMEQDYGLVDEANSALPKDVVGQFVDALKEYGVSENVLDSLQAKDVSAKELLGFLKNEIAGVIEKQQTGVNVLVKTNDLPMEQGDSVLTQSTKLQLGQTLENIQLEDANSFLSKDEFVLGKTAPDTLKNIDMQHPLMSLLKHPAVSRILQSQLSELWTLTPEQVSDKVQVQDLYRRLQHETQKMIETLSEIGKESTPISQAVNQLSNNVDFMNQLNHLFAYVQLPLKLSGGEQHGDLYVYTNKKHMAAKDGNVSALLHLDMTHLGALDIYVAMSSNKHIQTQFYLQDESTLDLIALHMDELTSRIEKRGYTMDCQWSIKENEESVVDHLLSKEQGIIPIACTSFDAKV